MTTDADDRPEENESTQGLEHMEKKLADADEKLKKIDEEIQKAKAKAKPVLEPEP